jgi:hypothetical protein
LTHGYSTPATLSAFCDVLSQINCLQNVEPNVFLRTARASTS